LDVKVIYDLCGKVPWMNCHVREETRSVRERWR
jgi:hypothetical protein